MSRILLLMLFILWMIWLPNQSLGAGVRPGVGLPLFLGALAMLVLGMGLWSRLLARRLGGQMSHRSLRMFNRGMLWARVLIPVWMAVGLFALGWGQAVLQVLRLVPAPLERWGVETPGILVGTLPALAAWMGLWWSQYPTDRALREHSVLIQLDGDLPIHAPSSFWRYASANLRLQVLFALVPVLLIVAARDLAAGLLRGTCGWKEMPPAAEALTSVGAAALIFLLAPEILRRVLDTQPLVDSPLRQRLEALCRQHGLRYRDILLWQTQHNMGNAAVMGILPQVRYVMLSDLLMETMTDQQIEAVFAHELGHIVHRHMLWYVVFALILTLGFSVAGTLLEPVISGLTLPDWLTPELVLMPLGVAAFLLAFGYVSRRFERQADVFAARTVGGPGEGSGFSPPSNPQSLSPEGALPHSTAAGTLPRTLNPCASPVGQYGAALFGSALYRVAVINNIPAAARSWCHGSIAKRIEYLRHLSADPARTARFDRGMGRIYAALVILLALSGGWAIAQAWQERDDSVPPNPTPAMSTPAIAQPPSAR